MKKSGVRFNQDSAKEYEFVHGRKPRAFGNWSFQLHRDNGASTEVWYVGRFTDARQHAIRDARDLGCSEVTVNT